MSLIDSQPQQVHIKTSFKIFQQIYLGQSKHNVKTYLQYFKIKFEASEKQTKEYYYYKQNVPK